MKSSRRPSEIEKAVPPDRVHQVFGWIIAGQTEHDIVGAIKQHWPEADAAPLIVAAVGRIEKAGQFDPGIVRGWCFEAYRDLYRRMIEVGDFGGAMRAVKLITDFAGSANVREADTQRGSARAKKV